jgi:hypothetical protein
MTCAATAILNGSEDARDTSDGHEHPHGPWSDALKSQTLIEQRGAKVYCVDNDCYAANLCGDASTPRHGVHHQTRSDPASACSNRNS